MKPEKSRQVKTIVSLHRCWTKVSTPERQQIRESVEAPIRRGCIDNAFHFSIWQGHVFCSICRQPISESFQTQTESCKTTRLNQPRKCRDAPIRFQPRVCPRHVEGKCVCKPQETHCRSQQIPVNNQQQELVSKGKEQLPATTACGVFEENLLVCKTQHGSAKKCNPAKRSFHCKSRNTSTD